VLHIVVGLGNPGHTYHGTRHNVGFAAVQLLAERHHVPLTQRLVTPDDQRPACVYGDVHQDGRILRLLMPLTMMNESGQALRALDIEPQRLLIVCDDVNLPLGVLRLRSGGGAGGHHGLESCLAVLGTEQVPRLRIGVGAEPLPSDLTRFVLSPFTSDERPAIGRALEQAADACEVWAREGIDAAMNHYNRA
jgi:PTH1 family peptidyl-tRNA hydrolase